MARRRNRPSRPGKGNGKRKGKGASDSAADSAGYVGVSRSRLGQSTDPGITPVTLPCGKLNGLVSRSLPSPGRRAPRRPVTKAIAVIFGALGLAAAGGFAGFVFVEVKSATGEIDLGDVVRNVRTVDGETAQERSAAVPAPADCPTLPPVDPPWMVAGPPSPPAHEAPEAPRSLERRIAFWTKVWGERGDNQHYIVDERRPWIVHAEIDCRDLFPGQGALSSEVEAAKNSCGSRLTQARKQAQMKLRRDWSKPAVLKLYDGDKRLAKSAEKSLIAIQGRKEALARAKDRAAPHLGHAEGLFALEEVPRIYARAAIVESLWRPEALSRSGAAGAYQFMAKTGRQFLAVEEGVVDERLDPLRSSWAAARYMSQMAKQLDSWPLVLTAYNTGPSRMKKVMKARRTEDIGKIADAGDWGEFGFDGQNYYAQIAAIGRLTKDEVFEPKPITGRAVKVEQPLSFDKLAACVEAPRDVLAKANPALAAAVIEGNHPVPAGYVAHIPTTPIATASVDPKTTKTITLTSTR